MTIRVSNFKAIGFAELRPDRLTVITGANSSGKSSLVQSVLFFAQSFGQPQTVINGDLVRLGEPTDVLRNGSDEVRLGFLYTVPRRDDRGVAIGEYAYEYSISLAPHESQLRPVTFSLERDGEPVISARETDDPAALALSDGDTALTVVDPVSLSLPDQSYMVFAGLTPARLVFQASWVDLEAEFDALLAEAGGGSSFALEELLRIIRSAEPDDTGSAISERLSPLRHSSRSLRQRALELSSEEKKAALAAYVEFQAPGGWRSEPVTSRYVGTRRWLTRSEKFGSETYLRAVARLGGTTDRMERLAADMLYLGPLRDDPRVAYPLGHTVRNLPVGEKGEFTAAYLERQRGTSVSFVTPEGRKTRKTLWNAVSDWCRYLGIAENVKVTSQGKMGHQLGLEIDGRHRDPTAVGVGASQLLPVVVLVLGAPQLSTVFLEQPELHLHPKVQSRLGDFFAFARPDLHLVVETHSEYLITRLRLRVAEESLDARKLSFLFATRREGELISLGGDEEETADPFTEFTRLNVSDLGDFNVWPIDFFDALGKDTVDLAQAITRRLNEAKDEGTEGE